MFENVFNLKIFKENVFNLEIFKGIEKSVIEKIIEKCPEKDFNDGDKILTEGQDSNGEGYIIKSGSVSISINGNEVSILNEGNIFGEIALLNEEKRTATVTAKGNIKVLILNVDDLINMINNGDNTINKTIMNRIEENMSRGN